MHMPDLQINIPPTPEPTLSLKDIFKYFIKNAFPMMLSYTFSLQMLFLVFFLSRLNADEHDEAAITPATSMIYMANMIGISILLAMSTVAGKQLGALKVAQARHESEDSLQHRRDGIASVHHHGLAIAAIMIPIITLPLVYSGSIFRIVFKQDSIVAAKAQLITQGYAMILPGEIVRLSPEQKMFTFGRTKQAMYIALLNFAIGTTIAWTFAFGKFGAPKLEEKGLFIGNSWDAYATGIGFSLYMGLHPDFKDYPFFRPRNVRAHLTHLRELLNIGGFILVGNLIEMILVTRKVKWSEVSLFYSFLKMFFYKIGWVNQVDSKPSGCRVQSFPCIDCCIAKIKPITIIIRMIFVNIDIEYKR